MLLKLYEVAGARLADVTDMLENSGVLAGQVAMPANAISIALISVALVTLSC
jgi:hypothetical protein